MTVRGHWRKTLAWIAASAALMLGAAASSAQQSPPATTAPADVQEVKQIAATLRDTATSPAARDEAARRLVARHSPEAKGILADVLTDASNAAAQLSAAKALIDDPSPDPALIDPLFSAMGSRGDITEPAARALASYRDSPVVLARLISVTQQTDADTRRRTAALRNLGFIPERRAAATLVGVVKSDDRAVIRDAAADGLANMTGIFDYGHDAARWSKWWETAGAKNDAEFRADIQSRKAASYDRLQSQVEQLSDDLSAILIEQYQAAPTDAQKEKTLLRYFQSGQPMIRVVAARIVQDDFTNAARATPPAAKQQLRSMLADVSPAARRAAADAIRQLNDTEALQPLLTQLAQETDPTVKERIAAALGPIGDLRAVDPLLKLLDDPSRAVIKAACGSLGDEHALGTPIGNDSQLAARVAAELMKVVQSHQGPADEDVRTAAIRAMVFLKQVNPLVSLYHMGELNPNHEPQYLIRMYIVKAFGIARDPKTADTVVYALNDAEQSVRLETVKALRSIHSPDMPEVLAKRLNPTLETDESVRGEVWTTLTTYFPEMTIEQLNVWTTRVKGDALREIAVLVPLVEKLRAQNDPKNDLPLFQQRLGDAYLSILKYPEAVAQYRAAMDARLAQDNPAIQTAIYDLSQNYMQAMLRNNQYDDALAFASRMIARKKGDYSPMMGLLIQREVEQLVQKNSTDSAIRLIDAALKLTQPLPQATKIDLIDMLNKLRPRVTRPATTQDTH